MGNKGAGVQTPARGWGRSPHIDKNPPLQPLLLNGRFNLPVFTHDERLTTFEAKGERKAQGGQRGSYRDNPVDAIAAKLVLQGWLDEHPAEPQA